MQVVPFVVGDDGKGAIGINPPIGAVPISAMIGPNEEFVVFCMVNLRRPRAFHRIFIVGSGREFEPMIGEKLEPIGTVMVPGQGFAHIFKAGPWPEKDIDAPPQGEG